MNSKRLNHKCRVFYRVLFVLSISIIMMIVLSSCGARRPPQKARIIKDLSEELSDVKIINPLSSTSVETVHVDIKDLVIEKRQTNDKSDIVFCTVELRNNTYCFTRYLRLSYVYYDQGGWILEDYDDSKKLEWKLLSSPFTGADAEKLKSIVRQSITEVGDPEQTVDLEGGIISYRFPVRDEHQNGYYSGFFYETLSFDGARWTLEEEQDKRFFWTIDNTVWKYNYYDSFFPYGKIMKEVEVQVHHVDTDKEEISGSWYWLYHTDATGSYGFDREFPNNVDQIEFKSIDTLPNRTYTYSIRIYNIEDRPSSYVDFKPDSVEAHFNAIGGYITLNVDLERENSNPSADTAAFSEESKEAPSLGFSETNPPEKTNQEAVAQIERWYAELQNNVTHLEEEAYAAAAASSWLNGELLIAETYEEWEYGFTRTYYYKDAIPYMAHIVGGRPEEQVDVYLYLWDGSIIRWFERDGIPHDGSYKEYEGIYDQALTEYQNVQDAHKRGIGIPMQNRYSIGDYHTALGCSFYLPDGFVKEKASQTSIIEDSYEYSFYHAGLDMTIEFFEINTTHYVKSGTEWMNDDYNYYNAGYSAGDDSITYFPRGDNWFVVSGYSQDKTEVFYKRVYGNEVFYYYYLITYPTANKSICDQMVGDFAKSFRLL